MAKINLSFGSFMSSFRLMPPPYDCSVFSAMCAGVTGVLFIGAPYFFAAGGIDLKRDGLTRLASWRCAPRQPETGSAQWAI